MLNKQLLLNQYLSSLRVHTTDQDVAAPLALNILKKNCPLTKQYLSSISDSIAVVSSLFPFNSPLPGVLENMSEQEYLFFNREQGILSNYFQGTRELLRIII